MKNKGYRELIISYKFGTRPTDKVTADSRSVQSFAIIKNTGHGNFVIGRFHARARNGLSV